MPAHNDIEAFHAALRSSRRIMALCGAGLSASSGLPTFRGADGFWRRRDATQLATTAAFRSEPGLVWLFYAYRRHLALRAQPNDAHRALAALARTMGEPGFLCVTQNVDDLSQRAGHPPSQLLPFHGSLFDIKCSDDRCAWLQRSNRDDPFCPALASASVDAPLGTVNPILDPAQPIPQIEADDIPHCPSCKTGLQRPGVVWFGEDIDQTVIDKADDFLTRDGVDMLIVVGTSAQVWPAAGYILKARRRGARIAVVDPNAESIGSLHMGDFAFSSDAATSLPSLLEPVIGAPRPDGSFEKE
ncbi:NAD-dependent protein deacetylase, SIR2 family [Geosmithia morbida]|uniref:NAD-dependent protein deacetylase, SIR2 family n=1 Tax=Geosmithia morbida TaxID=1094350 RepID=A0A9P4YS82_9HYPO|nr:NAD-dependent protein deacetylase, SIR2 family [Geosmithia morbida]KAF4122168.1 NAD-dependent protein deacetylase, SIR2 family [Geosmithia morbida]